MCVCEREVGKGRGGRVWSGIFDLRKEEEEEEVHFRPWVV